MNPLIAVKGVRSSCETSEIKLDLTWSSSPQTLVGFHEVFGAFLDFFFKRQIGLPQSLIQARIFDGRRGLGGVHRIEPSFGFGQAQRDMDPCPDDKSDEP